MATMKDKYMTYMKHDDKNVCGFFEEYRWLSNFHLCPVFFEGREYLSTEHAYQAAKFPESDRWMFQHYTCPQSKTAGALAQIVREVWDTKKYDIMASVVFDKFYRNLDLRRMLLETGNRHLEETNHWKDVYWGACAFTGKGENKLGKILMQTREFWSH